MESEGVGQKDATTPQGFFVAAHREWHLSLQNETDTPYGAAHNATAHPDDGYIKQETVDAIANMATATASDCAAIAQLTATVERLTAELVTLNIKLVASLQPQQSSRASHGGGALHTIVPSSGAACPTVVDGRLQVLVVGTGGRTCAG